MIKFERLKVKAWGEGKKRGGERGGGEGERRLKGEGRREKERKKANQIV